MRRVTQARWWLLFGLLLCLPFAQARSHHSHDAAVTSTITVAGLPPEARGCTSDTLLTKSAVCGRRCEAGAPAPKGSAPPCRARYHEYTVKTQGAHNRGIVCGVALECYYSDDHYQSFKRIREDTR